MPVIFEELFTVAIKHTYFSENKCRGIEVQPTVECKRILNNYGMLFKLLPEGFTVLFQRDKVSAADLSLIKFSFYLNNTDPYFNNYTSIDPLTNSNNIWYFSNTNKKGARLFVDEENPVYEKVKLRTAVFEYLSEEVVSSYEIKDALNNTVDKALFNKSELKNKARIDLRHLALDTYSIVINNKLKQAEKFITTQFFSVNQLLGVVDIFPEAKGNSKGSLIEKGQIIARQYEILFKARKTIWQYYLVKKYAKKIEETAFVEQESFSNIKKEDEDKKVAIFRRKDDVVLPDGTTAWLFQSEEGITLQEQNSYVFRLKNTGLKEVSPLPFASGKTIKPFITASGEADFYSEIFFFL